MTPWNAHLCTLLWEALASLQLPPSPHGSTPSTCQVPSPRWPLLSLLPGTLSPDLHMGLLLIFRSQHKCHHVRKGFPTTQIEISPPPTEPPLFVPSFWFILLYVSLLRQPCAFCSSIAFHLLSAPPDYKLLDSRKLLAPAPRTVPGMHLVLNK